MPTTERLRFPGATGANLAGRLERPDGSPRAYALFAHCFTCGKDAKAAVRISRALAERGIAVLRFDFTGLGESEGDFAGTGFSSNLEDLVAAADFLRSHYQAPQLLVGHSLGGAAALAAAARIPESRAVSTIGAPADTRHLRETLLARAPHLAEEPETEAAEVSLGGRRFRIGRGLLADLEEGRVEPAVAALGRALLLFHSPVDEIVGIEHARRLFEAAAHPKSFISLDGADHLLLADQQDSRFVAELLAAWSGRYLALAASAEEEGEPGVVEVRAGASGLRQEIRAGRHRLQADEPEEAGGTDAGPNPYDLLLAALGACKSMTLRLYADRKRWPLRGTRVHLQHSRIHAQDCAECETKEGKLDQIEVELALEGPLDNAQRQRLLEIADMCPVHRTLTSEIRLVSRLREN